MARARAATTEGSGTVSFRDWVVDRQRDAGAQRKGERTRDRIRLATIELLNDAGYRDMKVSDICERAGVTPPVLYLYFDSKQSLVRDVLGEFLQAFMNRATAGSARTPFQAIYDANLHWVRLARANAGLMRCLLQFSEAEKEFADLFAQEGNRWNLRIVQSVAHRFPRAGTEEDEIHFIVHALSGLMDEITRKLFMDEDPGLLRLVARVAPSDEALAGMLTTIWHRALYGFDPAPSETRPLAPRLKDAATKAAQTNPKPRTARSGERD